VVVSGDVPVVLARRREYDEVRRDTASLIMPAASSIACWLEARVRLEGMGAAGVVQQFCRGDRERAVDF
jgi:hypothetical protein